MSESTGTISETIRVELGDRMVRCWGCEGFDVGTVKRRCRELSIGQATMRDMCVALGQLEGVRRVQIMDRFGGGMECDISGG